MTYDLLTGFILFALVSSLTPGPNNLMLMASGANFGIRRSIPHAAGIFVGFPVMIVVIGLFVTQAFQTYPKLHTYLTYASIAYLLFLSYKIATAAPRLGDDESQQQGNPITFLQAAGFQWVNPKAWTMALTAVTVYTPQPIGAFYVAIVALIFGLVCIPCTSLWVGMGTQIRHFLSTPRRLRAFNWLMAVLLVASVLPVLKIW